MVPRTLKYQAKEYKTKVKYLTIKVAYEECEVYTPTKSHFMHDITEAINNYNNRRSDWTTRYDIEEFCDYEEPVVNDSPKTPMPQIDNGKSLRR